MYNVTYFIKYAYNIIPNFIKRLDKILLKHGATNINKTFSYNC